MTSWSSPTTSGGCTRSGPRSSDSWRGLRLQIHQDKSVVFPCDQGIRFLGYRVFPTHRLLVQENVRRFRRRMRWMQREFAAGRIGFDAIRPRIMSWIGHARHANTYRLRSRPVS